MFHYDVVSQGGGKYWYDFNHDFKIGNDEIINTDSDNSDTKTKEKIYKAILKSYEIESDSCNKYDEKKLKNLGQTVDVRFFSDINAYKNIGFTSEFFGSVSGLGTNDVISLRNETNTQITDLITKLDQMGDLPTNHPYAELKKSLIASKKILEKTRIEIVHKTYDGSSSTGNDDVISLDNLIETQGSYDRYTDTMYLTLADKNQPLDFKILAEEVLGTVIHELDHASMYGKGGDDSLIPPWTEHQYTFQNYTGECTTSYPNDPDSRFRGDEGVSTSYSFSLDFKTDQTFTYDSVVEAYWNYPILSGGLQACVPEKFAPSRKAMEIHAFQMEARYLCLKYLNLTADEINILQNSDSGDKEKLQTRIKEELSEKMSQETLFASSFINPSLLWAYFGFEKNEKPYDLNDYVNQGYENQLEVNNPANCFQPELPD